MNAICCVLSLFPFIFVVFFVQILFYLVVGEPILRGAFGSSLYCLYPLGVYDIVGYLFRLEFAAYTYNIAIPSPLSSSFAVCQGWSSYILGR